jgi:hypothetical protein
MYVVCQFTRVYREKKSSTRCISSLSCEFGTLSLDTIMKVLGLFVS